MAEPPVVRPAEPPIARLGPATRPQPASPKSSTGRVQSLLDKKWLMFVTLFGVTAALGIPFLWKSRAFSRNEKIFWSVVVSAYTLFIFWLFYLIMAWCYGQITQSLS